MLLVGVFLIARVLYGLGIGIALTRLDEDEGCSPQKALLEKRNKTDSNVNDHRRRCTFRSHRIGSRQKIVILVTILVFATMIASFLLIWIGTGKSPIDSAVIAQACICDPCNFEA